MSNLEVSGNEKVLSSDFKYYHIGEHEKLISEEHIYILIKGKQNGTYHYERCILGNRSATSLRRLLTKGDTSVRIKYISMSPVLCT